MGLLLANAGEKGSKSWQEEARTFAQAVRVSVASVSASCTVVPLWSHFVTAPLAVLAAASTSTFLERRMVGDTAGIVAVHLVGGVISLLSVGFFARPVRFLKLSKHAVTKPNDVEYRMFFRSVASSNIHWCRSTYVNVACIEARSAPTAYTCLPARIGRLRSVAQDM